MNLIHAFIDRPVLSIVLSLLIIVLGAVSYGQLPVTQYPEIAPPAIQVTANYPGASAQTAADAVATVLEQEINGVEDMLYMRSENTADGRTTLTVTFEVGTDLDMAQVLVQNRVAIAEPFLPEAVQRQGVEVRKSNPDLMMVVHIYSPDGSRDSLYLSNFARIEVIDRLARLEGVGVARMLAERAYAMRVWIDPDRAAMLGLTPAEVVAAIRANNAEVAAGVLNQPPTEPRGAFEVMLDTRGRLLSPEQFGSLVVKTGSDGRLVRLRDVAAVELGAQTYGINGYLDDFPAQPIGIFQRPGSNALETADAIRATMEQVVEIMPPGVAYSIAYDPTQFIRESIDAIYATIVEATALVILVIVVFLQRWRAAVIPILAIPVSLIGTFTVMNLLGVSLNNLSLFGLVLAIGIVVDDAIVVVENVERLVREGLPARQAAHRTMDEVGGALVAIATVLSAVFVPAAFISGISGAFYQQFALTVATATIISLVVSLTLSPALAALLFRHPDSAGGGPLGRGAERLARAFNDRFDRLAGRYAALTRRLARRASVVLVVYVGLLALTGYQLDTTPTGFIPEQDQGYLMSVFQLPPGAALERTDKAVRQAGQVLRDQPLIMHAAQFAGLDGPTFTNASNAGVIFSPFVPFEDRLDRPDSHASDIQGRAQQALGEVREAVSVVIMPPAVRGLSSTGGWKLYLQDRAGVGLEALESTARDIIARANALPELTRVFTFFNTASPEYRVHLDYDRAEMLGVPASRVNDTLEVLFGSRYVNDFNFLGRTFRVLAQADGPFRDEVEDLGRLQVRSVTGAMVPLGSLATVEATTAPARVPRYNLFQAIGIQGSTAPGVSTGDALAAVDALLAERLPPGIGYEWTELALQERLAADTVTLMFTLAVLFVFLLLAALYESWSLPLAVILIVPMCLLAAVTGVDLRGIDNNILVQVGFIVLIGLASKNAILIVEFARQRKQTGDDPVAAAAFAARLRLRPILMTSLAFILGVVPLALADGAGAEMRQALGTSVFFGMLGVTLFGLIFTPVFYVVVRRLTGWLTR